MFQKIKSSGEKIGEDLAKEQEKKKADRKKEIVEKLKKEREAWEKEHKQRANLGEADVLQKLGFINRHSDKKNAMKYYVKARDMLKKVEPSPEHKIGEVLQGRSQDKILSKACVL